jgi:hypothetical protein
MGAKFLGAARTKGAKLNFELLKNPILEKFGIFSYNNIGFWPNLARVHKEKNDDFANNSK